MKQGRLIKKEVGERLICFGANGTFFFRVATLESLELKEKRAPLHDGP
jgi:hypothetical protein